MAKVLFLSLALVALLGASLALPQTQKPFRATPSRTTQANEDEIKNLPGAPENVPFRQYAGYLPITSSKNVFYWFVEAWGVDPSTAPVVFWTNGGPGCSGLIGFMTEHGPLRPTADGKLALNEFAWNKLANMVYIEQPAGVGFSYTTNPSELRTGDDQAAADNYKVLLQFYEKFPDLLDNELYLTSESYGGHYIPTWTLEILKMDTEKKLNFKGFAVGNPYTNPIENAHGAYDTFWGHQTVPKPTYDKWNEKCSNGQQGFDCLNLEAQLNKETGNLNPYALDYPVCNDAVKAGGREQRRTFLEFIHSEKSEEVKRAIGLLPPEDYKPCEINYAADYLNRQEVKQALHAKEDITWSMCSNTLRYNNTNLQIHMEHIYKDLIDEGANLRMLVYSGDDDSVCGTIGTQGWLWDLGLTVKQGWQSWDYQDSTFGTQVGGYLVKYHGLSFATIRGAGHEVPAYRPESGLHLFSLFLSGKIF